MTTRCDAADCTALCDFCNTDQPCSLLGCPQHDHCTAGTVTIVRTAAGWTVEGDGAVKMLYDSPPATPQDVGGLALALWEKGYAVSYRDERGQNR